MQITDKILMIRPIRFGFNVETAGNNTFQHTVQEMSSDEVTSRALQEFDAFVDILRSHEITVDVVEDTDKPIKPDAVYPNNWLSMHTNGAIVTYPMYSKLRRLERREDIIQFLEETYDVDRHYAFEQYEEKEQYLEGTGSMVIDNENGLIYACLSPRTDIRILEKFRVLFEMDKVVFHALYHDKPIYHTNVVMALGERFAVCCLECIPEVDERRKLEKAFADTGKELIAISIDQMASFAGNVLQLKNPKGDCFVVMSTQAFQAFTDNQRATLQKHGTLIHSSLDTIEYYGGGSARCMIAENFLPENS